MGPVPVPARISASDFFCETRGKKHLMQIYLTKIIMNFTSLEFPEILADFASRTLPNLWGDVMWGQQKVDQIYCSGWSSRTSWFLGTDFGPGPIFLTMAATTSVYFPPKNNPQNNAPKNVTTRVQLFSRGSWVFQWFPHFSGLTCPP